MTTVSLEIPGELAHRLGADAGRLSREALGLEAYRQGLWADAELGQFPGLGRLEVDQFLRDHGVELAYEWEDLEREREIHRKFSGSEC